MDAIKTSYLSMAHIISINPIIYECEETKQIYLERISNYLKIGKWNKRKYVNSMLEAYKKIMDEADEVRNANDIGYYKNFIVFDLLHFLGYEISEKVNDKMKLVEKQYLLDFSNVTPETNLFPKISKATKSKRGIGNIQKFLALKEEKEYALKIGDNLSFRDKKPFDIMVTATMSAGKSTFINSLTGKYICLSQNMACTSKIHSIINKPFEDGVSYEYDHDLVMNAGKDELLNNNELNTSDKIYVSTHYFGKLGADRIIINDSPGVNFNGDSEHKEVAARLIKSRRYDLLIYVMNSTQLSTNDENEHLDFVKQNIGRTPVIFVLNKVDSYNVEEENIMETIERQVEYLSGKGIKNPVVCPVSSRAGYLAKQFLYGSLTRSEKRELYNFIDKFEQMKLTDYYNIAFPKIKIEDNEQEEIQLLKSCGLSYIEEIVKAYTKGEK